MSIKNVSLFLSLALSGTVVADTVCLNGALTDSNGDGWGWENNQSCRVNTESTNNDQPTANNGCDYSNADSNGGWGWNSTSASSCPPIIDNGNQPGDDTTVSTHNAMVALIVGGWDCARRFPHYNNAELTAMANSSNGGWIYGAIKSWNTYADLACSYLNSNCGRGSSTEFDHRWTLDFQPNGQVAIDRNQGRDQYWTGRTIHNWQLSQANAQLTITPEPATPLWGQFSEIGFEWFNGERYMHLYPAEADSPRLTCKARP